ncbi:hypothetical protein ACPOL_7238 (plasmid) [Acidisarcina polymorpha]|uniref:BON domain-containing protein n=1 Tax=Acidisarcina polymorpha TaxID=2211140 RepID=A0A2Z5GBR5_9BACT|nr:BON domain-containing protein [Acidisarcina polymorpha]AXC16428.1 hypothetical protein ACPOL_7238 [Acidisarcina polymorpha]
MPLRFSSLHFAVAASFIISAPTAITTPLAAQSISDDALAAKVNQTLFAEAAFQDATIQATAHNGTVTLTGSVPNSAARILASTETDQLEGVKTVLNNLIVGSMLTQEPPAPLPRETRTLSLPNHSILAIRLDDYVSTETAKVGDTFHGVVSSAVYCSGYPLLPAGTPVLGHVIEAKSASKLHGLPMLTISLMAVRVNGSNNEAVDVPISTIPLSTRVKGTGTLQLGRQIELPPQTALRFESSTVTEIPVEFSGGKPVYRQAASGKATLDHSSKSQSN